MSENTTYQLVKEILKHCKRKEKESTGKLKYYFDGEYDSNQTEYERKSNHREIGVKSNNDEVGYILLRLLRQYIDDCPESILYEIDSYCECEEIESDTELSDYQIILESWCKPGDYMKSYTNIPKTYELMGCEKSDKTNIINCNESGYCGISIYEYTYEVQDPKIYTYQDIKTAMKELYKIC